jgi:hypothetical protein
VEGDIGTIAIILKRNHLLYKKGRKGRRKEDEKERRERRGKKEKMRGEEGTEWRAGSGKGKVGTSVAVL